MHASLNAVDISNTLNVIYFLISRICVRNGSLHSLIILYFRHMGPMSLLSEYESEMTALGCINEHFDLMSENNDRRDSRKVSQNGGRKLN
jgi:hypothetical protein